MLCADRRVLSVLATRTRRPQRVGAHVLLRLSVRLRSAHNGAGCAVALGLEERQLRAECAGAEQEGAHRRTRWPDGRAALHPLFYNTAFLSLSDLLSSDLESETSRISCFFLLLFSCLIDMIDVLYR